MKVACLEEIAFRQGFIDRMRSSRWLSHWRKAVMASI
jgi:hypothetical protein